MPTEHILVPAQTKGMEKDLSHHVETANTGDVEDIFIAAKARLLDVNNWKQHSAAISAAFRLTDSQGKEVNRSAHKGDHIRIDIPGPGPVSGGGYDWVTIEAIQYDDYPDENRETIAMRVRPVANPADKSDRHTAHFLTNTSTSTFVIQRIGKEVHSLYYGRNEEANTDAGLMDKVRNSAVAIGAWAGLSDMQWKSLITGFIETI